MASCQVPGQAAADNRRRVRVGAEPLTNACGHPAGRIAVVNLPVRIVQSAKTGAKPFVCCQATAELLDFGGRHLSEPIALEEQVGYLQGITVVFCHRSSP
jgi:hypothetical protein